MSRTLPSMSYISLAILTRIEVDRLVDVLKDLHVPGGIIGGALVRIVLGRPPRSSPDLRRGMEIAPYRCRQLKGKTGPIAMTRNLETLSPTEELICGEFCSVDQICTPSTPLVKGKKTRLCSTYPSTQLPRVLLGILRKEGTGSNLVVLSPPHDVAAKKMVCRRVRVV
jgi:hypothetical protein